MANESKYEKTLTLKMSTEERQSIKSLAEEKGMTIKGLIFQALDKFSPNWKEKK